MKYILSFFLILTTLSLTGCFEKKTQTELPWESEEMSQLQELSAGSQESQTQNTPETSSEPIPETPKQETNTDPSQNAQTSSEVSSPSPETVEQQQEIIQDAEEDLEKLFRDIIPSE